MKVALNQLLPKAGHPEINFRAMEQSIKQSVEAGAELCIFPEDFLYGVLRQPSDLRKAGESFEQWVGRFCALAKHNNIDLIPGTLPRRDKRLFNTAVYIDKNGAELSRYSKHNLWLSERDEYSPSLEPALVFQSILGKTALIICWDMMDHRLFESAVRQGAEWIICVSFWSINQAEDLARKRGTAGNKRYSGFSDSALLDVLIPTRALEYNVGLLFCNFGGAHEYPGRLGIPQKAISAGRSQIVMPYKQQNAVLRKRSQATLVFDLDLQVAAQTLKDTEIWYGRREDIVKRFPYNQ